jgi:gamma-glutamylcyclotransferase (GGCT)/AIG2-like uncharacterized protein YtfP
MSKKTINILTYGTLRKGYGNHHYMENSKFIGKGKTVNKYQMSASGIPFVHPDIPLHNVVVEVYEVTEEQLPFIDRLEGYDPNNHEKSWYKRTPIPVKLDDGKEITASIYFNDEIGSTIVESGDYKDYR